MRYNESLNKALHEIMLEDETVYLIGEDICDPYGGAFKVTKGLSTAFPDRVINTPISEAAIVGIATGLAMQGFKPIVEIMFGDFITLCADQIINGASKFVQMFDMDIPLIIRTPMGGYRGYGPTHSQSLETLFFHIPNLRIIYPSIYDDPGYLLKEELNGSLPTLFCEAKPFYGSNLAFRRLLERQPDVSVITYGNMVPLVNEAAAKVFIEEEIYVEVIDTARLKPLGVRYPRSEKIIVTEEGRGFGELISAYLNKPITIIQRQDSIIPSAKYLEQTVLPSVKLIERVIYNAVS
jgi:pyruvate/2-oxoglutarate/acetoin dehydrogenase E1 component